MRGLGIDRPFDIDLLKDEIDDFVDRQRREGKQDPEKMTISSVSQLLSVSESAIRHLTFELGNHFTPPYKKGITRIFYKNSILQVVRLLNYLHITHVQYAGLKKFLTLNSDYLTEGIIEKHLDAEVVGATYKSKGYPEGSQIKKQNVQLRKELENSLESISNIQDYLGSILNSDDR